MSELDLPVLEAAQILPVCILCCYSVKDDSADLTEEPISKTLFKYLTSMDGVSFGTISHCAHTER